MEQSRKNASEAEAEDRKWSRTGGQGNGISDLDNAGLQGLYLHIVDKGSDEDSKLWMKGKASRGGESRVRVSRRRRSLPSRSPKCSRRCGTAEPVSDRKAAR